jgi:hypothetical protein
MRRMKALRNGEMGGSFVTTKNDMCSGEHIERKITDDSPGRSS